MKLRHRIQEWLAERIKWVQYPNVRAEHEPMIRWNRQMPWEHRVLLALYGVIALAVSSVMLFFLGIFFLALFTA